MIGSVISGRHSDYVLAKLSKKSKDGQKIVSEMRLQAAVPSFFLIPAGYFIYGWTTQKQTGVYGPLIGLFICKYKIIHYRFSVLCKLNFIFIDALGQMWAFTPSSVYLVDSKPGMWIFLLELLYRKMF